MYSEHPTQIFIRFLTFPIIIKCVTFDLVLLCVSYMKGFEKLIIIVVRSTGVGRNNLAGASSHGSCNGPCQLALFDFVPNLACKINRMKSLSDSSFPFQH